MKRKKLIMVAGIVCLLLIVVVLPSTMACQAQEIVAVPKVVGLTAVEATSALEEVGLEVGTEQAFSSSVELGLVISSDPVEGVIVQKGSTVTLIISKGPEMVAVPNVVGLTAAEAKSSLEEAGLKASSTTQAFSVSVEAGLVLSSDPAEGASVQKGSTVDLVVSKGPEMVAVPKVVGLTAVEATSVLEEAGLKASTEEAFSSSVELGLVISSDTSEGASVQKGSTVHLVVSKGPEFGLYYEYFEGSWSTLPDFDILTPVDTGNATNFDIPADSSKERFGYRFMGYIEIVTDGDYTFYTISDDGSQLYIGTTLVVDNDGLHSDRERSGVIHLSEGLHRIMVTYFELGGTNSLGVQYQGPEISKQPIPDSVLYRNY